MSPRYWETADSDGPLWVDLLATWDYDADCDLLIETNEPDAVGRGMEVQRGGPAPCQPERRGAHERRDAGRGCDRVEPDVRQAVYAEAVEPPVRGAEGDADVRLQQLGLDPEQHAPGSDEVVASAIRRYAAMACPCSRRSLIRAIVGSLEPVLFEPELPKSEGRVPEKVVEITRRLLVQRRRG